MSTSFNSREQLIAEHEAMVVSLAKKVHRTVPPHVRLEDLISYGQLGLTQAARSFREDMGSAFSTYAYYRVRGAIFDGLAKMSWASRAAYQRRKADQMANEAAAATADERPPSSDPEAEAQWLASSSERLAVVYLASGSEEQAADEWLEDSHAETPQQILENRELSTLLRQMIDQLPEVEQQLMRMVYYEDESLSAAAEKLGHTRSWASRLHARILSQLARDLAARGAV